MSSRLQLTAPDSKRVTPVFSTAYALLLHSFQRATTHLLFFQPFAHSLPKQPGCHPSRQRCPRLATLFQTLCFHTHANCSACNSFLLILMQTTRGVVYPFHEPAHFQPPAVPPRALCLRTHRAHSRSSCQELHRTQRRRGNLQLPRSSVRSSLFHAQG